jgi:phytoene dehydrogenase-like protein
VATRQRSSGSSEGYDAVVVGSGINSLAAAALLAHEGWRVCVLERNDWLGGAIRTAELTRPGFHHEVFSSWHPQFVGSYAYSVLREELAARGVEYLWADVSAADVHPDGEAVVLTRSHAENVAELDRWGDGEAWAAAVAQTAEEAPLVRALLANEPTPGHLARLGVRHALRARSLLATTREWTTTSFRSEQARGLFAAWALHSGVGPDARASAVMARVITVGKQLGGSPVPVGGGSRLVEALAGIVRAAGGACETGTEVERVLVDRGRAVGVRVAGGESVSAARAVLANVTPQQLYLRLLEGVPVPARVRRRARRYRYGRAGMAIHMALSEPLRWEGDERLGRAALVHLTDGLESVARAVGEADAGLLPTQGTIVVGQPVAVDPSRAPAGASIVWIQLHELPSRPRGDAAGELDVGDGTWTECLRERYVDRIQARLARHAPNLESALLDRVALSPADLEAGNVNLVGGDMYSGSLAFSQTAIWRPHVGLRGHRTPVAGLFHIGASTQPGPGLGGASGAIVARALLAGA